MVFGDMLTLWLDYLGITQTDLAATTGMANGSYYSSMRRSKARTKQPLKKTQEKIFEGLKKELERFRGADSTMNGDLFWKGPPDDYRPKSDEARDLWKQLKHRAGAMDGNGFDLREYIENTPGITFEGRPMSEARRKWAIQTLALGMELSTEKEM